MSKNGSFVIVYCIEWVTRAPSAMWPSLWPVSTPYHCTADCWPSQVLWLCVTICHVTILVTSDSLHLRVLTPDLHLPRDNSSDQMWVRTDESPVFTACPPTVDTYSTLSPLSNWYERLMKSKQGDSLAWRHPTHLHHLARHRGVSSLNAFVLSHQNMEYQRSEYVQMDSRDIKGYQNTQKKSWNQCIWLESVVTIQRYNVCPHSQLLVVHNLRSEDSEWHCDKIIQLWLFVWSNTIMFQHLAPHHHLTSTSPVCLRALFKTTEN